MNNKQRDTCASRIDGLRDHITTNEMAHALGKSPKTLRKLHCLDGAAFGVRPVKIGNELRWPVDNVAALLLGKAA